MAGNTRKRKKADLSDDESIHATTTLASADQQRPLQRSPKKPKNDDALDQDVDMDGLPENSQDPSSDHPALGNVLAFEQAQESDVEEQFSGSELQENFDHDSDEDFIMGVVDPDESDEDYEANKLNSGTESESEHSTLCEDTGSEDDDHARHRHRARPSKLRKRNPVGKAQRRGKAQRLSKDNGKEKSRDDDASEKSEKVSLHFEFINYNHDDIPETEEIRQQLESIKLLIDPENSGKPKEKIRVEDPIYDKFAADSFDKGPDYSLPPMSDLNEVFKDLVDIGFKNITSAKNAFNVLKNRKLRVATMCSGTESPVIALRHILEAVAVKLGMKSPMEVEHLFSAEIVPFKQAFIQVNFEPNLLFRDIIEMATTSDGMATTAFGARKTIPGDVDILIAGFSCVDMSNLNNHKMTLEQKGESGDTLDAVMAYAIKHKPRLIILENVVTAPWEPKTSKGSKVPTLKGHSIAEKWIACGYWCQALLVDTKLFWLPHTRQRGYMVCVLIESMPRNPFLAKDTTLKSFVKAGNPKDRLLGVVLESIQRPASEAVEAFMLSENDLRVIRVMNDSAQGGDVGRAVNWGTCEASHSTYRQEIGLGIGKPLTNWTLGGYSKPHHLLSEFWIKACVERVKDSIDMQHLRNLRRGFDSLHKNRMIDLSQNIDRRSMDTAPSGFTGCVTPSGMPFATALGRPLISEEALKLQGMDPDDFIITLLNQKQLRDLAGNAMSCPTVGAVLFAAICMTFTAFPLTVDDAKDEKRIVRKLEEIKSAASSISRNEIAIQFEAVLEIPSNFLLQVSSSLQHCSCEGQFGFPTTKLVICSACGRKACSRHSANPEHEFHNVIPIMRQNPETIRAALEEILPMSLSFIVDKNQKDVQELLENVTNSFSDVKPKGKQDITNFFSSTKKPKPNRYGSLFGEILHRSQTASMHFHGVERTPTFFKVTYESQDDVPGALRLELKLSAKGAEWTVFFKTPRNEAGNSPLRLLLENPIARKQTTQLVNPQDLEGPWELRKPSYREFGITVTGVGECVPCYEWKLEIPAFYGRTIWSSLSIKIVGPHREVNGYEIDGTYILHQNCDAPMGVLYKKEEKDGSEPIFLMLDSSRYGHPDKDCYVFTTDASPKKFRESRSPIAFLHETWRPNSGKQDDDKPIKIKLKDGKDVGDATYEAGFEVLGKNHKFQSVRKNHPQEVTCRIVGSWHSIEATLTTRARGSFNYLDDLTRLSNVFEEDSCYKAIEVLCMTINAKNLGIETTTAWETVAPKDFSKFLKKISFVKGRIDMKTVEVWHQVDGKCLCGNQLECKDCAQRSPPLKWKTKKRSWTKGEISTAKKSRFGTVPTIADSEKVVVAFESPIESIAYEKALKMRPSPVVVSYQMAENSQLLLRIGVNVRTLIHRAAASLPKRDAQLSGHFEGSYRMSTHFNLNEKKKLGPFVIPDNTKDGKARNPPNFANDLYDHQKRSLKWMIGQEKATNRFPEERIVEATLDELNWRIEGRASREITVRGGILADQVGYGKTALVLGLFDSCFQKQVVIPKTGYLSISATIILVPNHLAVQWGTEADKFIGKEVYNVMVIKDVAGWEETSVAQFQNADLIIFPWSLLADEKYLNRVQFLSGMLPYPTGSGVRAEGAWYSAARKTLAENVENLKSPDLPTSRMLDHVAEQLRLNLDEAETNSADKPSFRLRGAARQKSKSKVATDDLELDKDAYLEKFMKTDDAEALRKLVKLSDLKGPPLEIFNPFRIVTDEYTYVAGQDRDTIANLQSMCKWFLSGTPGLVDFVDAFRLMKLLGLDLGEPALIPGIITPQNIKAMSSEYTQSEKFRSLLNVPSFAYHNDRHEYAQRAIQTFVRSNISPYDDSLNLHKHIIPVDLPPVDRAIYSELVFTVAASEMREKRPLGFLKILDREGRIQNVWTKDSKTKTAPSAVGALMICNLLNANLEVYALLNKRSCELNNAKAMLKEAFLACQFRRANNPGETKKQKKDNELYKQFIERATRNEVGDPDVAEFILELIRMCVPLPDSLIGADEREFIYLRPNAKNKPKSLPLLRTIINDLRNLCKVLVAAQRGQRFVRAVITLAADHPAHPDLKGCCAEQEDNETHHPRYVFVECGHVFCEKCIAMNRTNELSGCTRQFCSPPSGYPYLLGQNAFENEVLEDGVNAKLDKIVDLIRRIPESEQVLLFTQNSDHTKTLVDLFTKEGISHAALEKVDEKRIGDVLRNFGQWTGHTGTTTGPAWKIPKQVLILNVDNVSAAGSNLTNANHVIFACPYLAHSQTKYNSAMTQAIGRVRRNGQKRLIHIYFFLTLSTAEVDVFEARTKSILVHESDLDPNSAIGRQIEQVVDNEWDEPKYAPNVVGWAPSGFRMLPRSCFPETVTSGRFSSDIHEEVVRCMDASLEDDDDDEGDDGGDDGEDYDDDDDE